MTPYNYALISRRIGFDYQEEGVAVVTRAALYICISEVTRGNIIIRPKD